MLFQPRGFGADSTQHCRGGTKNFPIVTSLNIVRSLKKFSALKRYRKVPGSRLSQLVAHPRIFRLLINFDDYVMLTLDKMVQNQIVYPVYYSQLYGMCCLQVVLGYVLQIA